METHSSLTILINQPKGQHGNMLGYWRLESMEIVGTGCDWIKVPPSAWLWSLFYQIDTWPSSLALLHNGIYNWIVVIPLCIHVLLLLHACNVKIGIVHRCLLGCWTSLYVCLLTMMEM